jgi:formiminotetrahydrofolate cyclodeaminase
MTLAHQPLRDVLDALASAEPTPGGGTASALGAAIGASLLMMVSGLPSKRAVSDADRAALGAANRSCDDARERLLRLADRDSQAYAQVVAAFRLPKATGQERAARREAVQDSLRLATDVPMKVVRACVEMMRVAPDVARFSVAAAASDLGTAVELISGGARGAVLSVAANLAQIADGAYADAVRHELEQLMGELNQHAAEAMRLTSPNRAGSASPSR